MDAESAALLDPLSPEVATGASGLMREFNRAGVLDASDVHVARMLGALAGVDDDQILLAVALAVRAPRLGHVFVDLDLVGPLSTSGVMVEEHHPLPWPPAESWASKLAACEQLVAVDDAHRRPLRLDGTRLYLERYWREEGALAGALEAFAQMPLRQVELSDLRAGINRLFPEPDDALQRAAAACVALRGLSVIAGGPGTGKTTTVARAIALIFEEAAATDPTGPPPLVALCAPTGKAAARLQQAVHEQAATLDLSDAVRTQMQALRGSTIHRLLGAGGRPGAGDFRHGPRNRLAHDLLVVDETSMVSLSLMTRLLAAARSDARVVLVGDPDQLAAVEAGAVLRDIVGPAQMGTSFAPGMRAVVALVTGDEHDRMPTQSGSQVTSASAPTRSAAHWFGDSVVTLQRGHRFGSQIARLADAIRRGDADATLAVLSAGTVVTNPADAANSVPSEAIAWIPDGGEGSSLLRTVALGAHLKVIEAARAGDGPASLEALGRFRLLCAHRHGPYGRSHWTAILERWLSESLPDLELTGGHYVGEPLLITENDHELRLHNGDAGVVIRGGEGEPASAVFERDGRLVALAPSRLRAAESLYAMTIHKSQGSEFDVVSVILPEADSPILTRELLYTAVTRAQHQLILVGGEESVRAAVNRPVARATGLEQRLWGASVPQST
jgi:exodeoxyribonuclease V alpha subunit